MAITASQVKELREKTGVGMMDAKKALVETDSSADTDVVIAIGTIATATVATIAATQFLPALYIFLCELAFCMINSSYCRSCKASLLSLCICVLLFVINLTTGIRLQTFHDSVITTPRQLMIHTMFTIPKPLNKHPHWLSKHDLYIFLHNFQNSITLHSPLLCTKSALNDSYVTRFQKKRAIACRNRSLF